MNTHDRILDTALHLFNQSGTAAVSTNHIADALSISPGNLYYHFRNKEAIIRELFERQYAHWDAIYGLPDNRMPTLDDMWRMVNDTFPVSWDYRFIYRELIALLRRDDELNRRWVEVRARGFDGFRQLIDVFVAAGVLCPPGEPEVVTRLAELIWMINEFWLASVEVGGQTVDAAQMAHGAALMRQVLEPFIIS